MTMKAPGTGKLPYTLRQTETKGRRRNVPARLLSLLTTILVLCLCQASTVRAADIIIVQSNRSAAYAEALQGFHATFSGTSQTLILSDYAEVNMERLVQEERPKAILAVGDPAVETCRKISAVPVIALMALSFSMNRGPSGSQYGIPMIPSAAAYLGVFRNMGLKRVGVVYDREKTGFYLKQAQQTAARLGIRLITSEIRSTREALAGLQQLKGGVDAIWMLPDTTAVTSVTVDSFFLFSIDEQVPLLTFSKQYLAKGAAVSLDTNRSDMGKQAAELVAFLLEGDDRPPSQVVPPRSVQLHYNKSVVQRLGVPKPAP